MVTEKRLSFGDERFRHLVYVGVDTTVADVKAEMDRLECRVAELEAELAHQLADRDRAVAFAAEDAVYKLVRDDGIAFLGWPADEARRRDVTPQRRSVLEAPCIFCGYGGESYWQRGTHAPSCPWRDVGGALDRLRRLPELDHRRTLADLHASRLRAERLDDRVRTLEGAVSSAVRLIDAIGDDAMGDIMECDHSVGICSCDVRRTLREFKRHVEAVRALTEAKS